jgi:hypothetical protein
MSMVRWKLVNKLRDAGNIVNHTYGYITKFDRIALGLEKSHSTDAFVIARGTMQERSPITYLIKQVRKCNRKLFKGDRSHIKNTAARIIHGFQRYDKVLWKKIDCFVFGRRKTGYFELRTLEGTKIHASAKVKDLKLVETANTFLISYMGGVRSSPGSKPGVSATPAPTEIYEGILRSNLHNGLVTDLLIFCSLFSILPDLSISFSYFHQFLFAF